MYSQRHRDRTAEIFRDAREQAEPRDERAEEVPHERRGGWSKLGKRLAESTLADGDKPAGWRAK
jgi:hypothetical protein